MLLLSPCGTCFNAATARRPWRTKGGPAAQVDSSGLQCGHGPQAGENAEDKALGKGREAARRPAAALQCGHGPKAVENRSRRKRLIPRWLERVLRAAAR